MLNRLVTNARLLRILALIGNLGLLIWIPLWQLYFTPHPHINSLGITLAYLLPLLLPLPGIVMGKPYTHAWANFILMLYFLHSLTLLYLDEGQ